MDSDNSELNTSLNTLSIHETTSSQSQESTTSCEDIIQTNSSSPIRKMEKKPTTTRPPFHNTPEKIIFCLDTCCTDPDSNAFKLDNGSSYSSIFMLKRIIEMFVQNKNYIDCRHEFALINLDKRNVKWLQEFTNNPKEIVKSLNKVLECDQSDEFDLSVLLDEVWQMVTIPKREKDFTKPPPFVVRLILLYSRSYCTPILKKDFQELLTNPYFVIDVILTHDENLDNNKLQEIYESLQIDEKGYSYNFTVGRNATILHDSMAKLLSHPLQRPLQSQASYTAPTFEDSD